MRIEIPPGNEQIESVSLLALLQEQGWTVLPRPESIQKAVMSFVYEEIDYAEQTNGGELAEVVVD